MEKAELVQRLKSLVGELSTDNDTIYEFIVDRAWEMICDYCRLETVPEGLKNTLLSMAVDIFRAEGYGETEAVGNVKSVTEGDVSVSFGSALSAADNPSMAFLKNYEAQLNRYRKAGW